MAGRASRQRNKRSILVTFLKTNFLIRRFESICRHRDRTQSKSSFPEADWCDPSSFYRLIFLPLPSWFPPGNGASSEVFFFLFGHFAFFRIPCHLLCVIFVCERWVKNWPSLNAQLRLMNPIPRYHRVCPISLIHKHLRALSTLIDYSFRINGKHRPAVSCAQSIHAHNQSMVHRDTRKTIRVTSMRRQTRNLIGFGKGKCIRYREYCVCMCVCVCVCAL